MAKVCTVCKLEKELTQFSKCAAAKDGLSRTCKACVAIASRVYYLKNKSVLLEKGSVWAKNNRDKCRGYEEKYRLRCRPPKGRKADPSKRAASYKAYRLRNLEKVRKRDREAAKARRSKTRVTVHKKYHTDLSFRLKMCIRNRLRKVLRAIDQKHSAIYNLGCTVAELRAHLESKFLPGMTWANWCFRGWHIDHIMPLASFDLTDPLEVAKACHYTNLQPLWAVDNLSKGAKIIHTDLTPQIQAPPPV